jgi:hypothetical protein
MKHSKRRKRFGAELLCGDRVVAYNDETQFVNWYLICPKCSMEVYTVGHSPDTDRVFEVRRVCLQSS